ncbi:ABC transporter ATP-binding protein [Mesorhizobium sp. CC13]|uniref:ABC transporter ATP-binding protein n=2 Tax=Phyllobacteriaceae TaxID=69277 RepID=UPI003264B2F7
MQVDGCRRCRQELDCRPARWEETVLMQSPAVAGTVLSVTGVRKAYGDAVPVLDGIELSIGAGEFVSVIGPSGCGKTTLLTVLSYLSQPDQGQVVFDGRSHDAPPEGLAIVFQDYSRSLFPWRRNIDNVILGMHRDRVSSATAKRESAAALLAKVGLAGFEQRYPWQLSGGMQQRVAIARALAANPRLLLLDEPLAAVDAQTRSEIQDLILSLARERQQACLLVTHDVEEAIYMADKLVVLTKRPTRVREEIVLGLPKPRDQIETREMREFLKIRHHVMTLMRDAHNKS